MEPVAISDFCTHLRMRNYSPHTIENYGRDLRLFFAPLAKDLGEVSWRDIEGFIQQQHHAQLAATTINRRLNALKHFFEYLVIQTEPFPTAGAPTAKAPLAGSGPRPVCPDHAPDGSRPGVADAALRLARQRSHPPPPGGY